MILEAGNEIHAWTCDLDASSYVADTKSRAAVAMQLIVIGEAAARMSQQTMDAVDLPWPRIIGLRNRIAHGYASIDHALVWAIIETELPDLLRIAEERAAP